MFIRKDLIKSRYFIFLLSFTLLLAIIASFVISFDKEYLFPSNNLKNLHIDTYHEEIEHYSTSKIYVDEQTLKLNYQLTSAKDEPFVALFLENKIKEKFLLNTQTFNAVSIHLKCKEGKRIPVTLKFDYPSYHKQKYPEIPFTKVIDYDGEKDYNISLDEFEIRSWWLRYYGLNKTNEPITNHQNLKYFIVGSCEALKPNINDEINVSSIYFYHDNSTTLFSLLMVALLIYMGTFLWYLKQKKTNKKEQIIIPIHAVQIETGDNEKKIDKIKNYIGQYFSNPDLSVSDLQNDLGISSREIGQLIKSELNSSFSIYINMVRISEVKRLLKESDSPVSEIAYKCGYNQIPHFNRVFKKETGLSPKEFRDKRDAY